MILTAIPTPTPLNTIITAGYTFDLVVRLEIAVLAVAISTGVAPLVVLESLLTLVLGVLLVIVVIIIQNKKGVTIPPSREDLVHCV